MQVTGTAGDERPGYVEPAGKLYAGGIERRPGSTISRAQLEEAIADQTRRVPGQEKPEKPASKITASTMTGWDVRKFSERIGNDETLLREVADIFLEETPKLLARLQ